MLFMHLTHKKANAEGMMYAGSDCEAPCYAGHTECIAEEADVIRRCAQDQQACKWVQPMLPCVGWPQAQHLLNLS